MASQTAAVRRRTEALRRFVYLSKWPRLTRRPPLSGKIRTILEKKGQPIGSLDMLIAAHALSLSVRLITNNEGEFKRVPGLKVENWL
jgi:predicted nucleic acid-binding protein